MRKAEKIMELLEDKTCGEKEIANRVKLLCLVIGQLFDDLKNENHDAIKTMIEGIYGDPAKGLTKSQKRDYVSSSLKSIANIYAPEMGWIVICSDRKEVEGGETEAIEIKTNLKEDRFYKIIKAVGGSE